MSRRRYRDARPERDEARRPGLDRRVETAEGGNLDAQVPALRPINVEHAEALQAEAATTPDLFDVRPEDIREDRVHPDRQQRAEDVARWRTEPYAALASVAPTFGVTASYDSRAISNKLDAEADTWRVISERRAESRVVTLVRTLGGSAGPLLATVLRVIAYGKDAYGDGDAPFLDVSSPSGVRRWWVVNASALVLAGDVEEAVSDAKGLDAVVASGVDVLADWRR